MYMKDTLKSKNKSLSNAAVLERKSGT